jgi:hypothetical protein
MKAIIIILGCVICLASPVSALTTREKAWAIEAQGYFQKAKEQAIEQQSVIEAQNRENERLDQLGQGQQTQITDLSGQIEKAHKNEQDLARYNAYAKPIIEQVNRWWGIGGILYGFKVLSRHLFILIAVLAVLAVGVFALSFVFPAIMPFIRMTGSFIGMFFRKLGDIFRRR